MSGQSKSRSWKGQSSKSKDAPTTPSTSSNGKKKQNSNSRSPSSPSSELKSTNDGVKQNIGSISGSPTVMTPIIRSRRPSSSNITTETSPSPFIDSPLSELLSPFRRASTQWVARYMIISFAVIIRAAVSLGPYSGFQTEPMHGDFEAQRHWMELTIHLPMRDWYYYDLDWWGLDYPPLTAYHSWLLGKIGSAINSDWFALYTSRGLDDYDLKSYMRSTVIFSELALYIPAVLWFVRWSGMHNNSGLGMGLSPIDQSVAAAAILFQPAVILIDHGHFQYNTVMLGLALLSIVNLVHGHRLSAGFFFVLSLGFKQMALYYAPIIFAYMLGDCLFPSIDILRLLGIGIVVILTFFVLLGPLLIAGGIPVLVQSIHRIFPFARGIWEDKVANFWCTINTVIKLKVLFPAEDLQLISLVTTLVSIFPAMLIVFFKPRPDLLPWAFSAGAWGFFLFSFQVHEKSVLLPLMPATLLLSSSDPNVVSIIIWINNIASFSLWPLLKREGLVLQYVVVVFCWNWLMGNFNWSRASKTLSQNWLMRLIQVSTYLAAIGLHVSEYWDPSAGGLVSGYPDIYVLGNITLSFACFALFWLWTLYKLFSL